VLRPIGDLSQKLNWHSQICPRKTSGGLIASGATNCDIVSEIRVGAAKPAAKLLRLEGLPRSTLPSDMRDETQ
jgi:hypothetical protein